MTRRIGLLLLAWTCLLASPRAASAEPQHSASVAAAVVRTGTHDGFGRIVLDLPAGAGADAAERDGLVVVSLSGAVVGTTGVAPRNVLAIVAAGAELRLTPAAHTTWRAWHQTGQLVIDVFDAPAPPAPFLGSPPPPRHLPRQVGLPPADQGPTPAVASPSRQPAPLVLPAETTPPAATKAPAADVVNAPVQDVGRADLPPAPSPVPATPETVAPESSGPIALAATGSGTSVFLPFAASTGAAAFMRGGEAVIVFDERRPLDLAPLRDDPIFGGAKVQLLPAAITVRVSLPAGTTLRLAHRPAGWTLTPLANTLAPPLEPIGDDVTADLVRFAAASPGSVVSVPDPETGGALLVGTQQDPGQGVVVTRRTPAFTLLATLQGVAIEPTLDAVSLHVADKKRGPGFLLTTDGERGLSLDPVDAGALQAAAAAHLTRRWDLPNLAIPALARRLQTATDEAAAAIAQSRGPLRLAAVQAELALGLGAEAHALATLAVADDARPAVALDGAALDAVANLLAGRLSETAAIEDKRIDGSDEIALWRAARAAMLAQDGGGRPSPEAAAVFAATVPLVLAYPAPLRDRLLPLAAETMAQGGERAAARRLLDARKTDATLDYARALLDEAEARAVPALATLDRLAQSPDRRLRARAAVRAVELRLRGGQLTSTQAADALDRLIYAWRGDGQELALRLRVAALRVDSGNWRAALALLRETGGDLSQSWPDQRAAIRARMTDTFAEALAQDTRAALPPLELVSLVEENPDLLPDGEPGRVLAARLAERLTALDLPARAMPVLEKLVAATPQGAARAELGARLAELRLQAGDAHGARLALSDSTATDLPPALAERRAITFARAAAATGDLLAAAATLAALDTAAADEARASLLESAKDWPAAASALTSFAGRVVPETGPLDDTAARVLLRLASAAAQSGDEALLARLRMQALARMPAGKLTEMFTLLTESPVQGVADLPRAARETAAARTLPSALSAMAAPVAPR